MFRLNMDSLKGLFRSVLPQSAGHEVQDYIIPPNPYAKTDNWRPNEKETDLIRRTWSDDPLSQEELGLDIYTIIFYQVENAKELFPQLANVPVSELRTNAAFRSQAFRFSSTIDFVVKHLESPDIVREYLRHIGATHVRFMKRGFRPTLWTVFKEAIELAVEYRCEVAVGSYSSLSAAERGQVQSLWVEMAVTIVKHMYNGFADAAVKLLLPQQPVKQEIQQLDRSDIDKDKNPFEKAAPWIATEPELNLLVKTWSSDNSSQEQLGLDIYSIIFDKAPDVHKLFPQVKSGGNIQANPAFRQQAFRFVTVIDYVIKNLKTPARIDEYLYDLGATHVRYAARGFTPSMWKLFKEAIELAIEYRVVLGKDAYADLSGDDKHLVQNAWSKMSVMIVQKMYIGYSEAMSKPLIKEKNVKLEAPGPNPYKNVSWSPGEDELALIRRVWSSDADVQQQLGFDIYHIIFGQMPDIKKFFPYLKTDDEIAHNDMFRRQAGRIVSALDYGINNVHNRDSFNRHLQQLGARHVKFASRGFTPGIWVIFKEATELAIEYQCETGQHGYAGLSQAEKNKVQMIWTKLAALIVQQMYEGFALEVSKQLAGGSLPAEPAHPPASQPEVNVVPSTPVKAAPENSPVFKPSQAVTQKPAEQPAKAAEPAKTAEQSHPAEPPKPQEASKK